MKTLDDWLAHAERLHPANIALGLERVRTVWQRMGLAFACPVFTVAGTNGKGSTCAMLESILQQAGYRTGVYTSPHLVRFEERCRLLGAVVDAEALLPCFERVEAARSSGGEVALTYFEFTTLGILALQQYTSDDLGIVAFFAIRTFLGQISGLFQTISNFTPDPKYLLSWVPFGGAFSHDLPVFARDVPAKFVGGSQDGIKNTIGRHGEMLRLHFGIFRRLARFYIIDERPEKTGRQPAA